MTPFWEGEEKIQIYLEDDERRERTVEWIASVLEKSIKSFFSCDIFANTHQGFVMWFLLDAAHRPLLPASAMCLIMTCVFKGQLE